jgi:hypothetical protein
MAQVSIMEKSSPKSRRLRISQLRGSQKSADSMLGNLTPTKRSLGMSSALVIITLSSGLFIRFVPLGLPHFGSKYGGSALWALMIYWIISALLPPWNRVYVASLSGAFATSVECVKLYHSPHLDAFRTTAAGMLLLGRFFSAPDILAYWTSIAVGAYLDTLIPRRWVLPGHIARVR